MTSITPANQLRAAERLSRDLLRYVVLATLAIAQGYTASPTGELQRFRLRICALRQYRDALERSAFDVLACLTRASEQSFQTWATPERGEHIHMRQVLVAWMEVRDRIAGVQHCLRDYDKLPAAAQPKPADQRKAHQLILHAQDIALEVESLLRTGLSAAKAAHAAVSPHAAEAVASSRPIPEMRSPGVWGFAQDLTLTIHAIADCGQWTTINTRPSGGIDVGPAESWAQACARAWDYLADHADARVPDCDAVPPVDPVAPQAAVPDPAPVREELWRVDLTAVAYMRGTLDVRASSEEDAARLALDRLGDVLWIYEGLVEGDTLEDCAPRADVAYRLPAPR